MILQMMEAAEERAGPDPLPRAAPSSTNLRVPTLKGPERSGPSPFFPLRSGRESVDFAVSNPRFAWGPGRFSGSGLLMDNGKTKICHHNIVQRYRPVGRDADLRGR